MNLRIFGTSGHCCRPNSIAACTASTEYLLLSDNWVGAPTSVYSVYIILYPLLTGKVPTPVRGSSKRYALLSRLRASNMIDESPSGRQSRLFGISPHDARGEFPAQKPAKKWVLFSQSGYSQLSKGTKVSTLQKPCTRRFFQARKRESTKNFVLVLFLV